MDNGRDDVDQVAQVLGQRGWQLKIEHDAPGEAVLEIVGMPERYITVEAGVVTLNQTMPVGEAISWPSVVLSEDPDERKQQLQEIAQWFG